MVCSNLLDLLGLLVHNIGGVAYVVVNELLIADVDEGHKECHRCKDETEAPERNNLDQIVG